MIIEEPQVSADEPLGVVAYEREMRQSKNILDAAHFTVDRHFGDASAICLCRTILGSGAMGRSCGDIVSKGKWRFVKCLQKTYPCALPESLFFQPIYLHHQTTKRSHTEVPA
jgi:hypothetical protein